MRAKHKVRMMSNARTMSPSAPRSTLEELLESLKKVDDKPKDAPPPLPQRPTSRARLPSSLRGKKAMGLIINVLPLSRNSDSGKKVEETEPRVCNEPSSDVIEEKESGFTSVNESNGNGVYEDHTCALEPGEIASIVNNYMGEDREARIPSYFDAVSELPYETTYVNSEDIVHDNKQRTLAELQLQESQESSTDLEPTTTSQAKDLVPNYDTTTPPLPLKSNAQKEIRRANARKRWKELSLKKDSRVWCRSSEGSWVLGVVRSTDKAASLITTSDGKIIKSEVEKVLPANPDILEGVDDLIQLSYLNEPAVLHNLNYRYSHNTIYTKAGPVLVAVNPFKKVPIYTPEFIQTYRQRRNETLSPHVYITADSAYKAMMSDGVNQSIIISGESGAGKTETAKIAMQYLAALGGGGGVEEEILQTNPILEAFGNAKTLRNNNSSRFGKLIDIHFDSMGRICGAKIQTYLLEKSRVVHQSAGERSYHVFYQLCAGADSVLQERLKLRPASHYAYLNQSGCLAIENVNDVEQFSIMKKAMDIVQISREDQESAFEMLAAILWLGNISFSVYDNENHVRVDNNEAASNAAALLHCNMDNLTAALCTRKIHARHEDILQKLTHVQAVDARDALAKAIYAGLFDWLVDKVNRSLEVGKRRTGRSISILDIYGFESFEKNSFEQLCINYANERLQQHFNRHLFKLEQEEYIAEGVDYTRVEFIDNQECLDLIEKRPLGLISLLDEECTFPKATEITLGMKLEKHLGVNSCFKSERHTGFSIRHYAGEVSYDTTGVMEKNRDLLHADLLQLLSSCECSIACMFPQKANEGTRNIHGREPQRQSVATKFKDQLYKLMQRLESTAPHFVRCIKPNPYQVPDVFDNNLVLQQLRCCGVLEVVRITRSGYPTRYSHAQFTNRYGFLLPHVSTMGKETLSLCISILQQFNVSPEMYQVGLTKLFFRTGQIGVLEDLRLRTIRGFIGVQRLFRGYKERTYFKKLRKATILVQRLVRGVQARKRYRQIREKHRAAIVIQKHARGMFARRRFDDLKRCHAASILIQKHVRGMLTRATAKKLKERWHAATVIQRHARGLQARKRYREMRKRNQAAVTIQKHVRRMRARNEFMKTLQMVKVAQSVVRRWSVRRKFASILRQIRQENKKQALPILATAKQQLLSATEQITDREQHFSLPYLEQIKDKEQQFCLPYLTVINEGVMTRISPSDILELQRRAITAEKALREKEDENAILMQKVQQYESRWLEYEAKMNSMEDVWQKQMTSLQLSLAAAKKSLTNDELGLQHVKQDDNSNAITKKYLTKVTQPHDDLDWDDSTSVGTKTPEQAASYTTLPDATSRDMDAGRSIVGHLVKEFEHRTQVFNDDADFLVEVKSGQTEANLSPDDELKKLKQRFDLWKKDFKVRLRDTKGILQKLAHIDASDRNKKKWWGKRGNA